MKKIPIGLSDFKEIIESKYFFIDKSLLIKDIDEGSKIILYPRPRRFGKTLNLSMLKYFYDIKENNRELFNGLNIEKEETMKKQGKYPVIFITFKDVKALNKDTAMYLIKEIIAEEYNKHTYLLNSEVLTEKDKEYYKQILDTKNNEDVYMYSLKNLSEYLTRYYEEKTVILIDEYDMPLHSSYAYGYYEEMVMFIRNLLSGALKDNVNIEKAVLTGILRVAKESIFSGLNNLDVNSLIHKNSGDKFGFLEKEVEEIMKNYKIEEKINEVKNWYNGYNFGGFTIYNPWSILNYIDERKLRPYWVNTSGNELIKDLLGKADEYVKQDLNELIEGKSIRKKVEDNIVYSDIEKSEEVLWSFLLMSGYLRYDDYEKDGDFYYAKLRVPNEEVMYLYRADIISKWFSTKHTKYNLERVLKSLAKGNINEFRKLFIEFGMSCFSYFDVSGEEPEKFYHAFVLGMIVGLKEEYTIKSNRESGLGRYDIMLIPKNKKERGIIFEFKKVNKYAKETMEKAIESAKKQIIEKQYESEMKELEIENIIKIAVVFEGKNIEMEIF